VYPEGFAALLFYDLAHCGHYVDLLLMQVIVARVTLGIHSCLLAELVVTTAEVLVFVGGGGVTTFLGSKATFFDIHEVPLLRVSSVIMLHH
jgi:hypothetical protein